MSMAVATVADLAGELRAVVVFAAVLVAPGFCVGWSTDLLGFRGRSGADRLAWSVALSFAASAIGAVLVGRLLSLEAVCWGFYGTAVLAMALLYRERWQVGGELARKRRMPEEGVSWKAVGGFMAFALFAAFELTDIGVGQRLYLSVTVYDHALRSAFVDAVMRTGVPPMNPLLGVSDGRIARGAPMRYYYFWYVCCGAVGQMARASSGQALVASCVWAGAGLWAVLELCCRHFLTGVRRSSVAVLLLLVTGLDILAVLGNWIAGGATDADMEWWGVDQVASWLDTVLWVPHHLAALVCCVTAWVLVWEAGGTIGRRWWRATAIAGVCLASAFGLSTYVAAAFGMVVAIWAVLERRGRAAAGFLAAAYGISGLLLMPYLWELSRGPGGGEQVGPGGVLTLGLRRLINPSVFDGWRWLREIGTAYPGLRDTLAAGILLIPGYLCELGFYAAVLGWAAFQFRRGGRLSEAARTALVLTFAGLLVTTVVRSRVITTNDFGLRSALIPQFFLVLLGVEWWERSRKGWLRSAMLGLAGIGVAGSVYQAVALRLYLPVEERLGRAGYADLAERNAAMWRAGEAMKAAVPKTAVVQYNTKQPSLWAVEATLRHVHRQIAQADSGCEAVFGGDAAACLGLNEAVERIYDGPTGMDAAGARRECARLGVTTLLATRWDAVWVSGTTWVWTLPTEVVTPEVRVLRCADYPG